MEKNNTGSKTGSVSQPYSSKRNDGGGAPGPKYTIPTPPKPPKKK